MGDAREYSEVSEDRTEPFSQTEIQARLQRSRMEEFNAINSSVPLDKLVVPPDDDIRILMRPLARDRSVREDRNVMPVALRPEVAEEEMTTQEVLAVRQTAHSVSYTINIPDPQIPDRRVVCIVYYDPASDNQILVNRSNVPFTISRISEEPEESRGVQYTINPDFRKALAPGTWRITMDGTDLLDFRLLERPPMRLRPVTSNPPVPSGPSDAVNSTGKRSFVSGDDDGSPEKRRRPSGADGDKKEDSVIVFIPPNTASKGKELVASTGHPFLDLQPNETLEIAHGGGVVGCTLTMQDRIASSTLSSVFTAQHSAIPGRSVVVKVVNTTLAPGQKANEGALANKVISQAQTWLREVENHSKLRHKNIVHLYGGDARFLSLYMEPVMIPNLAAWRTSGTDLFSGDRTDALRILEDAADALEYLHRLRLEHNDIRPANILFSRERGAVLCDLGHSTENGQRSPGGTPWYMPPEYIGLRQRGPPSDVWALGVVMLYVMGKMSLPESRSNRKHPRYLFWTIAHVHEKSPQLQATAIARMRTWLNEITAVRNGLDVHDKLERLVHGMLAPNPKERLTMKDIVSQLFAEQEG
ncbi:kinase-like protein [Parathielavia appendiculata]|uniref:EKC/KEOPS complex subunit BUD32 n=1 Tax=Parathielavia appendiculata TaxID=2587402 RepID=A0AAN6UBV7_9PEZI|nr:kinase-like protein [Parathielavia appendiculata]